MADDRSGKTSCRLENLSIYIDVDLIPVTQPLGYKLTYAGLLQPKMLGCFNQWFVPFRPRHFQIVVLPQQPYPIGNTKPTMQNTFNPGICCYQNIMAIMSEKSTMLTVNYFHSLIRIICHTHHIFEEKHTSRSIVCSFRYGYEIIIITKKKKILHHQDE